MLCNGYINACIPKSFLSFQLFHADETMGFCKNMKSVKRSWSIVHSELQARVLPPLEGNNNGRKTNTHIQNEAR